MKPKVFETAVGQTVWLQPTGNAVRRWDGELYEGTVEKIAKKYIYVRRNTGSQEVVRVDKETMRSTDAGDINSGCIAWESPYFYHAALLAGQRIKEFRTVFSNPRIYDEIPTGTIGRIYRLLADSGAIKDDGTIDGGADPVLPDAE